MARGTKSSRRRARNRQARALTNAAPKAGPIADAETVKVARRQRHNPLRNLTPETLTRSLDSFEYGDLREFALLAEVVADRDDTLKSVKPKREKAASLRKWAVLTHEESPAAERHKEILEDFWKNVRTENAYDRNERGGIKRLIKQMMGAVSFKYGAHHIVWKPEPGKLRAVFEFVPLWFFENRTGRLRFIRDGIGIEGEELSEREWMITVGDGLMIACLIAYLAKRYCLQDWLAFSEKFSMPGTLGITPHGKDTVEGRAMKTAVESFSQDWSAVLYGTEPSDKDPIRLIQPNGNPTAMPMPALIERVDRKMAALYRGADLSSMSSKDGEGTGASLQGEESDVLDADDCEMISETLREVERHVIEWHFGAGTEPLAYFELQPPANEDKKREVEIDKALGEMGVKQDPEDIAERYGRDHKPELVTPAPTKPQPGIRPEPSAGHAANARAFRGWLANADKPQEETAVQRLRKALASDLKPLGIALEAALLSQDESAFKAALRKINARMPEYLESDALAAELAEQAAKAFAAGLEEHDREANAGSSDGARKGWETRRRNGWQPQRRVAEIEKGNAALKQVLTTHGDQLGAMEHPDLGKIDFRWGTPKGGIQHILDKHGREAIDALPRMILDGVVRPAATRTYIEGPDFTVMLVNNWMGQPTNHWVLTGYIHHQQTP